MKIESELIGIFKHNLEFLLSFYALETMTTVNSRR